MKKNFLTLLLLIVFGTLVAQQPNVTEPYIEVMGSVKEEYVPDEVYIRIQLTAKENKNESIDKQQEALIKAVNALGMNPEKDLLIKDMMGNTDKIWTGKKLVSQTREYQLKVTNTAMIAPLFAKLEELKVNSFSVERIQLSDLEKKTMECKIKAIQQAKAQAEALTSAIGQSIGAAIYIQDMNYSRPRYYAPMMAKSEMMNSADSAAPTLEFNKITVEVNIMARFGLKAK